MKKTSLLLLAAVTTVMVSSCGTSTYSVSNTEDGIYYRPSSTGTDAGWKEDSRITELKTRTASETGYGRPAQKSDTIYLSKEQSAAEIDYLPGKTYTVLLDERNFSSAVPDSLKYYYNININLNNYAYPYYYDWRWRWGFTFAWWPTYYDPWFRPWYHDPWYRPWCYDPWYYDPWYRPWFHDPWYRPYGPYPYHPIVYVDPRPVVRTHRGGAATGRYANASGAGRSTVTGRTAGVSSGSSRASIQDRNIRASVAEGRVGSSGSRASGSGSTVSETVNARSNAAMTARTNAVNASRQGVQDSHLSSSRAAYANYRSSSGDTEKRQQADPRTVSNRSSYSRPAVSSESRSTGSASGSYRRSDESSYRGSSSSSQRSSGYSSYQRESSGSSQRSSSYSSSQRSSSYSSSQGSSSYSSSQRSSYSGGGYSGGGGGFSGGGGGFSGGGGSRGGGGGRR